MGRGQSYPAELRERAVRLVAESVRDGRGEWDSIHSVTEKLGVGPSETVRKWVRRAEVRATPEDARAAEESEELKRLKAENRELRRANEILKAAPLTAAAESIPRARMCWGRSARG